MNYVVIFAGGIGKRMGNETPKQFLKVGGKPIIIHVLEKYSNHPEIDGIIVVCKENLIPECRDYIDTFHVSKVLDVIPGGETGQISIQKGIFFLAEQISTDIKNDIVLIHDGVRPLIDADLISRSIRCTMENGNSIAVSYAIETVITVDDSGQIAQIIDRSKCRNAKAPQCFVLEDIRKAHQNAIHDGISDMIDSAMLMSYYGYRLFTTECDVKNIKITTPNDYYMFKGMYENQ